MSTRLCENVVEINRLLETTPVGGDTRALRAAVPESIWDEWLWHTNAASDLQGGCLLNRMHLLALIITRFRALCMPAPPGGAGLVLAQRLKDPRACITSEPIQSLGLRLLNDSICNLQVLWAELVETEQTDALYEIVDACFYRFGVLALKPYPADILDDLELVDVHHPDVRAGRADAHANASVPGAGSHSALLHVLNMACVRNLTAFFFVAYRHLALASAAHRLDPSEPCRTAFESHLVSASLDEFYALSMYFDLNMAAVQQYRQTFQGMFHSISQVVYYQNPQYTRRKQIALADLQRCAEPISTLPLFTQLYADIPIKKEDELLPRGFAIPGSAPPQPPHDIDDPPERTEERDWAWFVVPGRIYLLARDGRVYYSPNIGPLCNRVTDSLGHTKPPEDD